MYSTLKIKKLLLTFLIALPLCSYAQERQQLKTVLDGLEERFDVHFIYDSSIVNDFRDGVKVPRNGASLEKSLSLILKGSGMTWVMEDKAHVVIRRTKVPVELETEPEGMKDTLDASRITAEKYIRKLRARSTGLEKMDGNSFNRGFAVLSSPDVIKTLQTLPGVSSGTELLSGMYVHGGTGYDNLYLLDGVPMYQVNHLAGLFSSFNTDIIENVDFYKSGFPARFGGRMSSIVDVSTKDGDMQEYHGLFSIGLLDGRLQFEGPLVKGKTSFNLAIRRSWIDVLSTPVLAIVNRKMEDNTNLHYAFGDFNARITHLFAPENKLTASAYHGRDRLKFGFDYVGQYEDGKFIPGSEKFIDSDGLGLDWGNTLASVRWENRISNVLTSDLKAYYSRYASSTDYFSYWWNHEGNGVFRKEGDLEDGGSRIHDISVKADFGWSPSDAHDIRFGASYEYHIYSGFRSHEEYIYLPAENDKTMTSGEESASDGHETALYMEDDISIGRWVKAGIGLRYVMFGVQDKTYHRLEPRAALNFTLHKNVSMKLSYTEMNQYIHNISTSNLDIPTNIWMPSTAKVAPMLSRQISVGAYSILPFGMTFDIEGYLKTMDHLREYSGYSMLYPPLKDWDKEFPEGKGLSYGAEFTLGYGTDKINASAAYTLSWTKRKFEDIYPDWFLNWNDNRHKLTLSATWKVTDRIDIYSAWNYRSGNRISIDGYDSVFYISNMYPFFSHPFIGAITYNVALPSYHRLDIGANFRKTTKRGNESIWNISIYNVYCRMNPMFANIKTDNNGEPYGVATGIIPIIPSFNYTLKF